MIVIESSRKAVKAFVKTNLSAAMPAPLSKIDHKMFDPTVSGKRECFFRLGENDFDEFHATVGMDLFLTVYGQDEDAWVGALARFFTEEQTLGNSVTLCDLKSIDLKHDLGRPEFLFIQVAVELTI